MLGLDGFVLLAVSTAYGELERAVETTQRQAWWPRCAVQAFPHGRRHVRVRDLPSARRPVTTGVVHAAVALRRAAVPGMDLVGDQRAHPAADVAGPSGPAGRRAAYGEDRLDVAAVARSPGIRWGSVVRAVREYGTSLVDDPDRLAGLEAAGVDQTAFLSATGRHPRCSSPAWSRPLYRARDPYTLNCEEPCICDACRRRTEPRSSSQWLRAGEATVFS